jgi:disulfide bond formation protein DsbB
MTSLISSTLLYVVLFSHLLLIFLVLALIFRNSWGRGVVTFVGCYAIVFSFLIALAALCGSLFYSNVVGFAPCELCWWQRILLYPQVLLFLIALKYKDTGVFKYAWRLSILALLISLYQVYIQLGGFSVLPCTAAGSACAKIFIDAFGYITIPVMSLTVCTYLLTVALMHRLAKKS